MNQNWICPFCSVESLLCPQATRLIPKHNICHHLKSPLQLSQYIEFSVNQMIKLITIVQIFSFGTPSNAAAGRTTQFLEPHCYSTLTAATALIYSKSTFDLLEQSPETSESSFRHSTSEFVRSCMLGLQALLDTCPRNLLPAWENLPFRRLIQTPRTKFHSRKALLPWEATAVVRERERLRALGHPTVDPRIRGSSILYRTKPLNGHQWCLIWTSPKP